MIVSIVRDSEIARSIKMSRQQMQFQLAYSSADSHIKCKSCQEGVKDKELLIGVKSDSMYDPMWYHFSCFWTRCWYRKQMSRHLDNFSELPGFSDLTPQDKERFKEAITSSATEESAPLLKRKSESDDTPADLSNKKSRPEAMQLPKIRLSATELLSKSSSNSDGIPAKRLNEEVKVALGGGKSITVSLQSGILKVLIASDWSAGGDGSLAMTAQQWKQVTSVFDDVASAVASGVENGDQVFPVDKSLQVRVSQEGNGQSPIFLGVAMETRGNALDNGNYNAKGMTFTLDQWKDLSTRAAEVEAAILRLSG